MFSFNINNRNCSFKCSISNCLKNMQHSQSLMSLSAFSLFSIVFIIFSMDFISCSSISFKICCVALFISEDAMTLIIIMFVCLSSSEKLQIAYKSSASSIEH